MQQYQEEFNTLLGVKSEPNEHELVLFGRARKYIQKLSWIPGIEMIAVSNSLSMYATHEGSDIDLFIVTAPRMIWFARFFVTLRLWMAGVWRHGDDIAGNFCLSFFVTTNAMNLEKIAVKNDIYLYYWIYHLKPIFVRGNIYEIFLENNSWVKIPEEQRIRNQRFRIQNSDVSNGGGKQGNGGLGGRHCLSDDESRGAGEQSEFSSERPLRSETKLGSTLGVLDFPPETFVTFGYKSKSILCQKINKLIRFFLLPRSIKSYNKLGRPEGVIISDDMLKFHPEDRRESIRDAIVKKNFDK